MPIYRLIVILALASRYFLDLTADVANLRHMTAEVPEEFRDTYDPAKYRTAQDYLREKTQFRILTDTIETALILTLLLAGGFNLVDRWVRAPGWGPVATGLAFAGVLLLAAALFQLPASAYRTFVIEARYGFNRTTVPTFLADALKSLLLAAVLGGALLAAVLWLFERAGGAAWLIAWGATTLFQAFLVFVAPWAILPLFNRFVPLEEGNLRSAVESLARAQDFQIQGVYRMDASRRSAKTNAFFAGFGKSRRIVLFDTLIEKHSVRELVAILAHEIGHYRMNHILWGLARSVLAAGLAFWLFSLFVRDARLFAAFGIEIRSVYAGLLLFGFLYTPIGTLLSIGENALSRRQEAAADRFALQATGDAEALIQGLKKLAADNYSNLTPHPLKVLLDYSHPPILDRIRALQQP